MTQPSQSSPLEQIPALLPALLSGVSLGRTQLIVDQLRGTLQRGGTDEIVMVALPSGRDSSGNSAAAPDAEPVAVALALTQPPSDSATVLHAGLVAQDVDAATEQRLAERLREQLHHELSRRGVRFVQWATDPATESDTPPTQRPAPGAATGPDWDEVPRAQTSTARWAEWLGLQPVATLRYLVASLAELSQRLSSESPPVKNTLHKNRLNLEPVERRDPESFDRFARLVQRTYRETLDCEPLSQMRSAEQILAAYHHSRAFQHQGWYRVALVEEGAEPGEAVGCLILAAHQGEETASGVEQPAARGVTELVYMGVVPEVRGRGLGRQLVAETVRLAERWAAERLILAVDERNQPAIAAYAAAGLTPLLRETVWAACLPDRES